MATFFGEVKSNLRRKISDKLEDVQHKFSAAGIREKIEESTGVVGQALRSRREREEKQANIQKQLSKISETTERIRSSHSSLTSIELSFIQIAKNFENINASFGVVVTHQEETNKSLAAAVSIRGDAAAPGAKPQALHKIGEEKDDDTKSIWDDVSGLLDLLEKSKAKVKKNQRAKKAGKKARAAAKKKGLNRRQIKEAGKKAEQKAIQRAEKEAAKKAAEKATKQVTKAAIREAAKKTLVKSLGKTVAKSIPFVGAAVGLGFAVGRMLQGDWVGAGVEAVSGLGSAITSVPATIAQAIRDIYFEMYGVWPEGDPKNKERFAEIKQEVTAVAEDIMGKKVEPQPEAKPAVAVTPVLTSPIPPPPAATPVQTGTGLKLGGGVGLKAPEPPPGGGDKWVMDMIVQHEGFKTKPYKDSLGLWTIGVGHLIGDGKTLHPEWDRELTKEEVGALFAKDYEHHRRQAEKLPGWSLANEKGQAALIDLTFNMGPGWAGKFKKGVQALLKGDFKTAADEFVDSNWFKQVKGRGVTVTNLLRDGGKGGATSVAGSPSTGVQVGQQSTDVAAAKPTQQNNVTVVAINQTNTTRKTVSAPGAPQTIGAVG